MPVSAIPSPLANADDEPSQVGIELNDGGDDGDHHRETEQNRHAPPRGRGPRVREHHRGVQVSADERGKQQQTGHRAGAVRGRQRGDHRRGERPAGLLGRIREATTDIDLAEEALRRHRDQLVGGRAGDVPAVDVATFCGLHQVGLAGVSRDVQRELGLDGVDHRGRTCHAEGHVPGRKELRGAHEAKPEERGEHANDGQCDQRLCGQRLLHCGTFRRDTLGESLG